MGTEPAIHIVSAMGLGDCLITLSLLERIEVPPGMVQVVGTGATGRVAALLRERRPIIVVLPDTAAIYTLKASGLRAALSDLRRLRQAVCDVTRPGDVVAFERWSIRNVALAPRHCRVVFPPRGTRVYQDRLAWARALFGEAPDWPLASRPARPIRRVVLNPSARHGDRCLKPAVIENLLSIAEARGWTLTLLDPSGQYAAWKGRVASYEARPALERTLQCAREADLCIGPDSFFIHLAYYCAIPVFAFFFRHYHDFLLPGMDRLNNYLDFAAALDRATLHHQLSSFVDGSTSPA